MESRISFSYLSISKLYGKIFIWHPLQHPFQWAAHAHEKVQCVCTTLTAPVSNNVSQCIELFNIAMPPTNKVQKPIPFQHVQVQPQKEHNVSCRVDVQKIWADFLSHRVHILKKVLGNFSSTCPPSLGKDSSTPLYHDMFWLSFLEFLIWGPIPEDHGAIPLVCALVLAPQIFCRLVLHNWTSRPDMHWTCTGHKGKLS